MAESHAVLECALIVRFRPLGLNVLLDRIDLGLILYQLLLDVIEAVVDVRLKDLVLGSVVLHGVVSHLLLEAGLVLLQHGPDGSQPQLFTVELHFQIICPRKFIRHLVLHLSDLLCHLLHLFLDSSFKGLDLLKVILSLFKLDLQASIGSFSILDLSLLESQLILLVLVLCGSGQIVLANHSFLHVLQEGSNRCLMVRDLALVSGLLLFETLHELVDLPLFLVEYLIFLGLTILATS